jgi:calcium-dependent protein kinase
MVKNSRQSWTAARKRTSDGCSGKCLYGGQSPSLDVVVPIVITDHAAPILPCILQENLQKFDARSKLEQSARLFIVANLLDQQEREALDGVFRYLDKLRQNYITKAELKVALLQAHGENSDKLEQMMEQAFDSCDVKKNGVIDYSEFLAAAADDSVLLTKKNLRATFEALDKSKTGAITVDDLKAFFNQGRKRKVMHKRDAKKLMLQVDGDGDGEISFEEFCDLMTGIL